MTPLGHASAAHIAGKSYGGISLPAILIGGVLPDFDFVFLFFDWFNTVHRVISHNLLFVIIASLAASAFAPKGRKLSIGLSLMAGVALHLLIDSAMDNNPSNGIGIALFWPFNNDFYSPFNLLHTAPATTGWHEPLKMIFTLIPGMVYEVPLYIVSIIMLLSKKGSRTSLQ